MAFIFNAHNVLFSMIDNFHESAFCCKENVRENAGINRHKLDNGG